MSGLWTNGLWVSTSSGGGGGGGGGSDPILAMSPFAYWSADQAVYTDTAMTTAAGDGDAVAAWGDLSGNGRHLIQSTAASRPTLDAASKALVFDGSDDWFLLTGLPALGPSRTLVAVLQFDLAPPPPKTEYAMGVGSVNTAGQRSGIARSASTGRFMNYDGATASLYYDDQGNQPGAGRKYLVTLRVDTAYADGYQPRVNGVVRTPNAGVASGSTDGTVGVGRNPRNTSTLHTGRIHAAILWDRVLTDQEMADVEAELTSRFAIG